MALIERLECMQALVSELARRIDGSGVKSTGEAADFVQEAALQSGFSQVRLIRLDVDGTLSFPIFGEQTICAVKFVPFKQNAYESAWWNSLREYTGSPTVYFRDQHWEIREFLAGNHKDLKDDAALDLALDRLAKIQACPIENTNLPVGLPNPGQALLCLSAVVLGGLEQGSKEYADIEYIRDRASSLLPEKKNKLVLAHTDFSMFNILFTSADLDGCRVIDWSPVLWPRYFDPAMFLIRLYNENKNRFCQKLNRFLSIADWPGYMERTMKGYLLFASLLHIKTALGNRSPSPLHVLLAGVADLLSNWASENSTCA